MKQSILFTKTLKEIPKDEMSRNAQILLRAGFIHKTAAGVYSFLPLGLRVVNKIINIVRSEMNHMDGQEILMSALVPKEYLDTTRRWEDFDSLFKLCGADKKEYALGATHEELVTPLVQAQVFSYKELPLSVYQIQTKFRNELRAKAGLIRGREFLMKDMYSFHLSEKDLDVYYDLIKQAYFRIFNQLGLGEITYLTHASGGAFTKYSHEFQTITEVGEDEIYLCESCKVAINKEIIVEQNCCPICGNKDLKVKKAVETGNIFKLMNRFSQSFDFFYLDEAGKKQPVLMGCYGLGISRLMGTIAEIFQDDKGLIWPEAVAPFSVHVISLNQNDAAKEITDTLENLGIEVLFDDRVDKSAGEKFADADLIGCPHRLVVSAKTIANNNLEYKYRGHSDLEMIAIADLENFAKKLCLKKS